MNYDEALAEILATVKRIEARQVTVQPAPLPTPDPMPGGGDEEIKIITGVDGPDGTFMYLGDSRTLSAGCYGFDPVKTGAKWVDPEGNPIKDVVIQTVQGYTQDKGHYLVYNFKATWTPSRLYEAGADCVFLSGLTDSKVWARMPLKMTVRKPVATPQRPVVIIPPPVTDGWSRPTEAQYLAADKLPVCRDNGEVDLAIERARFGRLPWANSLAEGPTAVVSYVTLSEGLAEHARVLALSPGDRASHWSKVHRIDDDLMGAVHCLGPQAGLPDWRYPEGGLGSMDSVQRLAGRTFRDWLVSAFSPSAGGPGVG